LDAASFEGAFEDHLPRIDRGLRFFDTRFARVEMPDQRAAFEELTRQRANLGTLIESVLEDDVGLELHRGRLVDFPPEQLRTLKPGGEERFRQRVHPP